MKRSYQDFADRQDPVPTKKVGDLQIMELFHGPTFAFKDVALQALGNLFEYFLKRKQKRITVVGATSGDTGSAAIYGLRGKENVECFILFPEGRVSPIQQLQMTSVPDENVHCIAVQVLPTRPRASTHPLRRAAALAPSRSCQTSALLPRRPLSRVRRRITIPGRAGRKAL